MDNVVDASVPATHLKLFIGHKIWTKPEKAPAEEVKFCELLDVWLEETDHGHQPIAWIVWDDQARRAWIAPKTWTKGVSVESCRVIMVESLIGDQPWWIWDDKRIAPAEYEVRPPGWCPDQPEPIVVDPPAMPEAQGDQFILPI